MSRNFEGFSDADIAKLKQDEHVTYGTVTTTDSNAKRTTKLGLKVKSETNAQHDWLHQIEHPINDNSTAKQEANKTVAKPKTTAETIQSPETYVVPESNSILDENGAYVGSCDVKNLNSISGDAGAVVEDVVSSVSDGCSEDGREHAAKLGELQKKQRLMEEQNKRRKEMLSKALADRTKQTAEEVMRLEKIKKELLVLDGQFSQDVATLRKKIDQACITFSDAEKHYLRVEKDFLAAKINMQKEREKKELLTEHLCALITHNELNKAKKLETLMARLVSHSFEDTESPSDERANAESCNEVDGDSVIDGVCQKTGKIVEIDACDRILSPEML